MSEPKLEPVPRGWLEKAYDANILTTLPVVLLILVVLDPLNDQMGYWPTLAIIIVASAALAVLVSLPVLPIKKRRAALDAELGVFECAHREVGSALKQRWAIGYAKAEPGRLLFQAKTGVTGRLAGPIESYSQLRAMGEPAKAPWSAFPRGHPGRHFREGKSSRSAPTRGQWSWQLPPRAWNCSPGGA
jgi:hypothetical protein